MGHRQSTAVSSGILGRGIMTVLQWIAKKKKASIRSRTRDVAREGATASSLFKNGLYIVCLENTFYMLLSMRECLKWSIAPFQSLGYVPESKAVISKILNRMAGNSGILGGYRPPLKGLLIEGVNLKERDV